MNRDAARFCSFFVLACFAAFLAASTARATIQEESCIYPDVEYPMPCDDED
jgi:hypothetical protein